MENIVIAAIDDIESITSLRVEQQIEDWTNTLNADFNDYASNFSEITKKYLLSKLNKSLFFALMYIDNIPVACCAVEELNELPQITICLDSKGRHGCLVSVYTKPEYRGKGYQQKLLDELLNFVRNENFCEITLTTNTPDAKHIYEKAGFEYISDKYILLFK